MSLYPETTLSRGTRRRDYSFLLGSAGRFLGLQADPDIPNHKRIEQRTLLKPFVQEKQR